MKLTNKHQLIGGGVLVYCFNFQNVNCQRNWRPLLMLVCIFIVLNNYVLVPYFNIPAAVLDEHIWRLIEVGTGGYIAGRSLEKITDKLAPVLANMKKQK